MRTFIVKVPDSDAERIDRYARARGMTAEAAAGDLLQAAVNTNDDIVARIRDVEQALERKRAKRGAA